MMESKIVGTVMPVLELSMQPNDEVFAESGQLSWMSMAVQMQTSTFQHLAHAIQEYLPKPG